MSQCEDRYLLDSICKYVAHCPCCVIDDNICQKTLANLRLSKNNQKKKSHSHSSCGNTPLYDVFEEFMFISLIRVWMNCPFVFSKVFNLSSYSYIKLSRVIKIYKQIIDNDQYQSPGLQFLVVVFFPFLFPLLPDLWFSELLYECRLSQ